MVDLELLCDQYGFECEIGRRKIHALINLVAIKKKFFTFKIISIYRFVNEIFKDVLLMIIRNHTLKVKYEYLVVLAEIARVQCISTASCERAFTVQNCIKTKQRNKMFTKNLEMFCEFF